MTPDEISAHVALARHRVKSPDEESWEAALVALADRVEHHLATIELVESKVRPGGVLDRADLDAREAARDALRRAVRR